MEFFESAKNELLSFLGQSLTHQSLGRCTWPSSTGRTLIEQIAHVIYHALLTLSLWLSPIICTVRGLW